MADLHHLLPFQNLTKRDKNHTKSLKSKPDDSIGSLRSFPKFPIYLILFISASYIIYTLKLLSSSSSLHPCETDLPFHHNRLSLPPPQTQTKTNISHIVFGIAASSKLWKKRKEYIKLWFKPENNMQGNVWIDKKVQIQINENLPPVRISSNTSNFPYTNKQGDRSAIRISRIVSETVRIGLKKEIRWIVMGDDDTVFVIENLIRVLSKYDHNEYYYIGSSSESHLQNIFFSYAMAYGGGGFAISYPLAIALEKIQDECIERYPDLYGSDDRIQACMAELGVSLTKEVGFHQYDVYGNLLGLLAAHPVTPFVSLHHLDVVEPIFPNMTRLEALQHLQLPMKIDSAGLMQQSICYDPEKKWTVSVSWGFVVQVFRGILPAREIEMPSRTFLNWYRRADYTAYAFNTRPVARNPCQKSFVFYMSDTRLSMNRTVSKYNLHRVTRPECKWKMADPGELDEIIVHKKTDPHMWDRSPRRNCCRIMKSTAKRLKLDVGVCREGEIVHI
ncbi:uncharacterized protein LOC124942284 [Impatiens glandulifera]|uniref:uncharacterized protein LOC124942284 n=1 Tax=Impatiens glandulifera TaxID=253017 RepID=UPI001FB0E71F|nr:uncharacterized protein LOC124942284 [Impatiens glandulifera]